ncbi:MAG: hypothetical protein MUO33_12985 [Sedimentisphaerales bacterium]|nr:hypothetical protein [Sedimentisphaerales bacterium]
MHMRYRYISIFRVLGIKLPDGKSEIVLVNDTSTGTKIVLQSDIDTACFVLDRRTSVANMMLNSFFRGEGAGFLQETMDKEIRSIRDDRKEKFGGGPFVVFEFSGEVDIDQPKDFRDAGEFVVSFDFVDKNQLVNQFRKEIDKVLMSFFLVTEADYEIKKVTDGIYLLDESGKVWYSFKLSSSAHLTVSRCFDDTSLSHLLGYFDALAKTLDFEDVYRLLVQSCDKERDNFQSFLFAWTALEIFVNKTFKDYEHRFFNRYVVREVPSSGQQFFDRLRNVMKKGKYRLQDKFMVISACLSDESEKDLEEFVSTKKVRDKFLHGVRIDHSNLPTERTILLVRKYLRKHLALAKL